ncbi:GTP-binding protein [Tenacibaculum sp. KUL113]|nr:GTP-binding protein [Tenacibaculum sp. KUL113]
MKKKPDNVVFNEETNEYDAYLKPYATNFTAPVIKESNSISWKKQNIYQANAQFLASFEEIKQQYNNLVKEYQYNELIYSAKFNFEPIVGKVYHLYRKEKNTLFLSILSPDECGFNFVGSFQLNSDKVWKKVK